MQAHRIADQADNLVQDLGKSGIPGLVVTSEIITIDDRPSPRIYYILDTTSTIIASDFTPGDDSSTRLENWVLEYVRTI
jgi:hypothetical protein